MPCYFPLKAYKDVDLRDRSKTQIVFNRARSWRGERLDLACGQCIGCRLEKARQWAIRCVHEASLYPENSFITLTYDPQHIPPNGSLCLRDFQLFMKRLRKWAKKPIRYYHCGEYGETTQRPHYHSLLFNLDFQDKIPFGRKNNIPTYTSDTLSRLWGKGFAVSGEVSFDSAGYVARYALKKVNGKNAKEHYGGLKPEYSTMSRRPGIGFRWIEQFYRDVYPRDGVVINGTVTRPPRYYDDFFGKKSASELALLKIEREKNEKFIDWDYKGIIRRISDSCDIRLIEKEKTKKGEVGILKRHKGW